MSNQTWPTPWPAQENYLSTESWRALKAFLRSESEQYRRRQRREAAKKRLHHSVYGLEFRARVVE